MSVWARGLGSVHCPINAFTEHWDIYLLTNKKRDCLISQSYVTCQKKNRKGFDFHSLKWEETAPPGGQKQNWPSSWRNAKHTTTTLIMLQSSYLDIFRTFWRNFLHQTPARKIQLTTWTLASLFWGQKWVEKIIILQSIRYVSVMEKFCQFFPGEEKHATKSQNVRVWPWCY